MKRNIKITPDIKYVIGIDFGHAETSAALCEIEWNEVASKRREKIEDIKLGRTQEGYIVSAICELKDGRHSIGEEALKQPDIKNIQIGFKQAPSDIAGETEMAMIAFMKEVYQQIRNSHDHLTDTNHVVFIARPADWKLESTKKLYLQMAEEAGIPVFDLTSEPRAALTYAYERLEVTKEFRNGGLVFDLGSSTLDLTYRSSNQEKTIDEGRNLGASIIDDAIFKHYVECQPSVQAFLKDHPEYEDKFKYCARKIKEEIYKAPEALFNEIKTVKGIVANSAITDDEQYKPWFEIDIHGSQELEKLNEVVKYKESIKYFISDFVNNRLSSSPLHGVITTGGASVMAFLSPLIKESCDNENLEIRKDHDPRLTVSRGIALLGTKDIMAEYELSQLQQTFCKEFKKQIDITKIVERTFDNLWKMVVNTINKWESRSPKSDELKAKIKTCITDQWSNIEDKICDFICEEMINENRELIVRKCKNVLLSYVSEDMLDKNKTDVQLTDEDKKSLKGVLHPVKESMKKFIDQQNIDTKNFWQRLIFLFRESNMKRQSRLKNNALNLEQKMRSNYISYFNTCYSTQKEKINEKITEIAANKISQIVECVKIPIE